MRNDTGTPENGTDMDVPPLTQLYFYLTKGCNLACRHCWLAPKFDPKATLQPYIPVDVFKVAIQEAKPLGLTTIKLTGGEPFLHPKIDELLDIILSEELHLTIETNGILCTRAIAEKVSTTSQPFVSVSLDGVDNKTHEWVRGVEGSFHKTLQGIENLVNAGIQPQIIMTLMRCNHDQIARMVTLAEHIGVTSIKFNILQPTARGEQLQNTEEALSVEEILKLRQWVDDNLTLKTKIKLFFDVPFAFRPLSRIDAGDSGICGIKGILGVIPSSHYALCGIGEHISTFVFGKVGDNNLAQIWRNHPIISDIRKGLPKRLRGVCSRCLMSGSCLASCIAQNYYRSGDIWASFWLCEQAEKAGLFPASRLKY